MLFERLLLNELNFILAVIALLNVDIIWQFKPYQIWILFDQMLSQMDVILAPIALWYGYLWVWSIFKQQYMD